MSGTWPPLPSGVTSINGDTTAAQTIAVNANTGLSVATSSGTTTFSNLNRVSLTDGATVTLDASLGSVFELISSQNPTLLAPTNSPTTNGTQKITIIFRAVSSNRTLSLTTGSTDSFAFGTDITALTATTGGTTDFIGCVYSWLLRRWCVVAYSKGY